MTDDHGRRTSSHWARAWACLLYPFRRRPRIIHLRTLGFLDNTENRQNEENRLRSSPPNSNRLEAIRRELPTQDINDWRTIAAERKNEVRKRYKVPSPEAFDMLRQAIIQVESSDPLKPISKLSILEETHPMVEQD